MQLSAIFVGVVALVLTGCYRSETDLIGSHAAQIVRANTLLNFDGQAYIYRPPNSICAARLSPTGELTCGNPSSLAIERTLFGNYIVQVRRDGPSSIYYYFLWFRDHDLLKNDCVVALGKDVAGFGASSVITAAALGTKQRVSMGILPTRLESELVSRFPEEAISDRASLLEITSLYESSFIASRSCTDLGGSRLNYDRPNLVIDGDRRHLREYDAN